MKWNILYYQTESGECPVQEMIDSFAPREQAKVLAWLSQLQQHGPQLPRPYADILEDGIHELRVKITGDQVRVLYFFLYGDNIILSHGFVKRQSKVPKNEITRAKMVREACELRFPNPQLLKEFGHEII